MCHRADAFHFFRAMLALCIIGPFFACDDDGSIVADGGNAVHDAAQVDSTGSSAADGQLLDVSQSDLSVEDAAAADSQAQDGPVSSCSPKTIATRQDLLQVISGLQWSPYTPPGSGALALSEPLVVSGPVTISDTDLSVPSSCNAGNTCMEQVFFATGLSSESLPAGVTLDNQESDLPLTAYAELTLANVTVRLRGVVENVHPWTFNFIPLIRIEPDCADECTAGSFKCDADRLCYTNSVYCNRCLGLGNKECACHELASPLPDGTACSYLSKTMTALCNGECQGGSCLYSGQPDAYCP